MTQSPLAQDFTVAAHPLPGALINAVRRNNAKEAAKLLAAGADVNERGEKGATPLIVAVMHDRAALVDILMDHGADPELRDNSGMTALMNAVNDCKEVAAQRLVERGADVNTEGMWGRTALFWAAHRPRIKTLRLLLQHGADAKHKDKEGDTAADIAGEVGFKENVALIERADELRAAFVKEEAARAEKMRYDAMHATAAVRRGQLKDAARRCPGLKL